VAISPLLATPKLEVTWRRLPLTRIRVWLAVRPRMEAVSVWLAMSVPTCEAL